MSKLIVQFNEKSYEAIYNEQTGYYEVNLIAPEVGGVYNADIVYIDLYNQEYEDMQPIQVWAKEKIEIETNKVFMWIFDGKDFTVKDIVELLNDYDINIDEETNENSTIKVLKKTTAKTDDIVAIKKNNKVVYWGIIDNIQNENGKQIYEYTTKYITNIFDRNVELKNEDLIKNNGLEDFIAKTINENFISNEDMFINKKYLQIDVKTHTTKQTTVSNVQDKIYNLHTWITNCTQNYDIVYSFSVVNKKFLMTIENKTYDKELIDIKAQGISNYTEVFETNVVSKVVVLTSNNNYILYLKTDRTTTTDMNDENRADGKVETVYTENYEDARQKALDIIKSNSYNHNITFDYYNRFIKVGTPIAIKTKESLIFDTYISSINITPKKTYRYICGNIRVNFLDKLLKERRN